MSPLPCPVLSVLASVGPVYSPGRLCWLSSYNMESLNFSAIRYLSTTFFCFVTSSNTSLNFGFSSI